MAHKEEIVTMRFKYFCWDFKSSRAVTCTTGTLVSSSCLQVRLFGSVKAISAEAIRWIFWGSISEGVITATKLIFDLVISAQKERKINLTEVRIKINVGAVIFEEAGFYWFMGLDFMVFSLVNLLYYFFIPRIVSTFVVSIHVKRSGNLVIFASSNPGGTVNWGFVLIGFLI